MSQKLKNGAQVQKKPFFNGLSLVVTIQNATQGVMRYNAL